MTERHEPDRLPHVDERLSAYLAGELDDAGVAEVEARLARDPVAVDRLEALEQALVELGDLDAVQPPPGYDRRLAERLAAARDAAAPAWSPAPRAAPRRASWTAVGTVAAAVLVGVLLGTAGLRGLPGGGGDEWARRPAAGGAGNGDVGAASAPEAAAEHGVGDAGPRQGGDLDAPAASDLAPPSTPAAPVLLDEGVRLPDVAALRARYTGLPEATALIGRARVETLATADAFSAAVEEAPPFRGGLSPGACLTAATALADGPPVIVRVERVTFRGRPALAYVVVGSARGDERLGRVDVLVVDPDSCTRRALVDLR